MNKELEKKIIAKLKEVYDPEIPVDIYELGLIYSVKIDENNNVAIEMTLTSPSCPEAEVIPGNVEAKVKELEEVSAVEVKVTFEPSWDKDMMSEEAKLELGML